MSRRSFTISLGGQAEWRAHNKGEEEEMPLGLQETGATTSYCAVHLSMVYEAARAL